MTECRIICVFWYEWNYVCLTLNIGYLWLRFKKKKKNSIYKGL